MEYFYQFFKSFDDFFRHSLMGLLIAKMHGLNGAGKETETKGVINSLYKVSEEFDTQLVRKHPEFAPFY